MRRNTRGASRAACPDRGFANLYVLAADRLANADAHLNATGSRNGKGFMLGWRAIALARQGRFAEARQTANDARTMAQESGEPIYYPVAAYAIGMAAFLDPDADDALARQWLETALSEAQAYGNRLMQLRAGNALARILRRQEKLRKAHDLLASVYALFIEDVETTDLKEAKAFLDQLETVA